MQAYNRAFSDIYNERWVYFAQHVAPPIQAFYESTPLGKKDVRLLDVCCGTGQLAVHFLQQGYTVVGIDLSEDMLGHARQNAAQYVETGQARFLQDDAADFALDDRFGLAVSTFDALNHLPDDEALHACFQCVHDVLVPGGIFIFDLNTRAGLRAKWNGLRVQDTDEIFLMDSGAYDEQGDKAWVKITGFVRVEGGLYQRFTQVAYNTVFDLAWVQAALLETGFNSAHCAYVEELGTPLEDPEAESRAFIVAQK
jgi:SAM-dependent methyltransferase